MKVTEFDTESEATEETLCHGCGEGWAEDTARGNILCKHCHECFDCGAIISRDDNPLCPDCDVDNAERVTDATMSDWQTIAPSAKEMSDMDIMESLALNLEMLVERFSVEDTPEFIKDILAEVHWRHRLVMKLGHKE